MCRIFALLLITNAGAWLPGFAADLAKEVTSTSNSALTGGTVLTNLPTIEAGQAIVVTTDLDFNGKPKTIANALREIERRHRAADGAGRTFAILDAWGETNANGQLRISMHLSMEEAGVGSLFFKPQAKELWAARIVPGKTTPPANRNLTILMADQAGRSVMLDGTKGARRVLDVPIHDSNARVRDTWPDGEEREFTFLYSVCGCPVKVKVRRKGEGTERSTELPVMFPDDPAAMKVINALMGWPNV